MTKSHHKSNETETQRFTTHIVDRQTETREYSVVSTSDLDKYNDKFPNIFPNVETKKPMECLYLAGTCERAIEVKEGASTPAPESVFTPYKTTQAHQYSKKSTTVVAPNPTKF